MKSKLLILILSMAAVLRLWDLGGTPIHLTNDEAALGYNAYSILKTGRDEHGELLPIIFRSFNDWKPGLYVYAAVPSVAIFGLNEFATRLPGAISGIVAVWLIYLVVKELFLNRETIGLHNKTEFTALFAGALLAINPWHIHFSRGAWEAGMSLTLTLAGIYFFLRAVRDKQQWILLSALLFGLTLITYQGAKLSTSLVVLGMLLFWRKKVFAIHRKALFKSFLVGMVFVSFIAFTVFAGKASRLQVFSVFSYPRPTEVIEHIANQGNEGINGLSYSLYHSELLQTVRGILGRWTNHYSARFLFFEGDWLHLNLSTPNTGVLLIADIFLLVFGFVGLAKTRDNPSAKLILLWLLVAPLPAALSRDTLNGVRSFNLVVPLVVVMAIGAVFLFEKINSLKLSKLVVLFCFSAYLLNFLYYLDQYFVHMNVHNAKSWQYGYKQLVETVSPLQDKYGQIVIPQSYNQPYIYFLFYQKYDPGKYLSVEKNLIAGPAGPLDALLVPSIENIKFEFIDWHQDSGRKGSIVAGDPVQIPPGDSSDNSRFKLIDEVKYPDGQTAFRVIEVL